MGQIIKSEGIVFRSMKYSETSLILDIYTKEKGLDSFIVSGVRKAKSKLANIYHPMNIINLVAFESGSKLSRIKEGSLAVRYDHLTFDVVNSTLAMFVIDLSRNVIKENESNLPLYNFIFDALLFLDKPGQEIKYFPIRYAVKLAALLGFEMSLNYSEMEPYFNLEEGGFTAIKAHKNILTLELSKALYLVLKGENNIEINKRERNLLLDQLMIFYALHIEGFHQLKSLSVLRALLS